MLVSKMDFTENLRLERDGMGLEQSERFGGQMKYKTKKPIKLGCRAAGGGNWGPAMD